MFNRNANRTQGRNAKRLGAHLTAAASHGWTPTNATPEQRERLETVASVVATRQPGSLTARLAARG